MIKKNKFNVNKKILKFETLLGKKNCYIDEIIFDTFNYKKNKIKILKQITKKFNINLKQSFFIIKGNEKLPVKKFGIRLINIENESSLNSKYKFSSFEKAIKYFLKFNFSNLI